MKQKSERNKREGERRNKERKEEESKGKRNWESVRSSVGKSVTCGCRGIADWPVAGTWHTHPSAVPIRLRSVSIYFENTYSLKDSCCRLLLIKRRIRNRGQLTRDGRPAWVLGVGLATLHSKKKTAWYEMLHRALDAGCCEHVNEHSDAIKAWNFLTVKDSAPCS
jgi:hypothetical protein